MSLQFTGGDSDRVSHGTSGLANIGVGTLMLWIYPDDVANSFRVPASKNNTLGTVGWTLYRPTADGTIFRFDLVRATTALQIWSVTATITSGAWQFIGVSWNTGGANGDQRMVRGTLTTLAAEVSYATQLVGSGAQVDDTAQAYMIGNQNTAHSIPGRIAIATLYGGVALSVAEMQSWQFRPRVLNSSCLQFTYYGFAGTSTQPDWSGGGRNGTVTGATVADHVPLGPPFGFDLGWMGAFTAAVAGRTTKNTDSRPLGIFAGMSRRMNIPPL